MQHTLLQVALVTPSDSKRFDALQTALSRPAPPEFPVVSGPPCIDISMDICSCPVLSIKVATAPSLRMHCLTGVGVHFSPLP